MPDRSDQGRGQGTRKAQVTERGTVSEHIALRAISGMSLWLGCGRRGGNNRRIQAAGQFPPRLLTWPATVRLDCSPGNGPTIPPWRCVRRRTYCVSRV